MAKVEETRLLMTLHEKLRMSLCSLSSNTAATSTTTTTTTTSTTTTTTTTSTSPALKNVETYWPHLSLVYGNVPLETCHRIQTELCEMEPPIVGRVMHVDRIEIWDTQGEPSQWTRVGSVQLPVS
jgi:hypothetical protein